jgi:hypothetical protein
MSYFADLDLKLSEDGIDPELRRLPRCDSCNSARQIVAYADGRVQFGCRACWDGARGRPQPSVLSVVEATLACLGCDDSTTHRLAELSNGDLLVACDVCPAVTVLR